MRDFFRDLVCPNNRSCNSIWESIENNIEDIFYCSSLGGEGIFKSFNAERFSADCAFPADKSLS